jgi:hypothetical protein
MPEDISSVVKDILKGICNFKGIVIDDNEIEQQLDLHIINGKVQNYRFTLIFRILSIRGTGVNLLARCCHEKPAYSSDPDIYYVVCDDPPTPQEVIDEIEEIFRNVEMLMMLYVFGSSLK